MLFKKIEGENAILASNGIYKQADIYERLGGLYAKLGSGFVRLYADGATSHTKTRIVALVYDGVIFGDRFGRLTREAGGKNQRIAGNDGILLLE